MDRQLASWLNKIDYIDPYATCMVKNTQKTLTPSISFSSYAFCTLTWQWDDTKAIVKHIQQQILLQWSIQNYCQAQSSKTYMQEKTKIRNTIVNLVEVKFCISLFDGDLHDMRKTNSFYYAAALSKHTQTALLSISLRVSHPPI